MLPGICQIKARPRQFCPPAVIKPPVSRRMTSAPPANGCLTCSPVKAPRTPLPLRRPAMPPDRLLPLPLRRPTLLPGKRTMLLNKLLPLCKPTVPARSPFPQSSSTAGNLRVCPIISMSSLCRIPPVRTAVTGRWMSPSAKPSRSPTAGTENTQSPDRLCILPTRIITAASPPAAP